jgi:diguanylate cyclase (GGDEF)-like protein/PAS domain S-box-containing protein
METGPIIGEGGEYLGALAMVTDVTNRKRMEDALITSEAKFRNLMEQSPYGIVVVDEQGTVVEWNQGQELLSGLKRAEVIGRPIWDVQFAMMTDETKLTYDHQNMRNATLGILENGNGPDLNLTMEGEIQLPDGTRRNVEMVMYSYRTKDGYQSGCITRDVTERKTAEHRMEYLATHDELTGLPNRLLYRDRLNVAMERMQREKHDRSVAADKVTAVMLLDLDNFKFINDTYGHDQGDRTLKIVAARLNESLRKTDTVARMGGDEFLLIHENVTSIEDVSSVAKKILTQVSLPIRIASFEHQLTASIGISLYPLDGRNDELLLKHADIAMYRAKQTGNRFEFFNFPDDKN